MAKLPPNAVHPLSRAEWRSWLLEHHRRAEGVWLVTFKKGTGQPHLEYGASVEEALCFGWIDSKPNKLDDERSMRWFAPRKAGTGWSRLNKERIEHMLRTGLMHPSGLARIEQAWADGSWTLLDAIEELHVPADLAEALAAYPLAEENFMAFPRSAKRGILEWIHTAKKPETRAARIAETARLANANERANQWRPKKAT
ncbi:MAG: YdeI/OmpD-associated family protein [Rhodothermales bacterium]